MLVDATGNVIKRFNKLGLVKTQTIYLYEAVVYDDLRNNSFTVCSMVSEKHDNISIYHWLASWLKSDVSPPKETCSDMSLALLYNVINSQYSKLCF